VAHIDVFKSWAETIRQDTDAFKALLESTKADDRSRKLAAGALQYLVSKMDLIPDWNEGIGVIDDVMVLRVCAALTQDHDRGALPTAAEASLERMANQSEKIVAFLGGPLYDKLKSYCAKVGEQPVRGITTAQLLEEEASRKSLYKALDEELEKTVPIVINDPTDAELRLKAYLTHKLQ
ncbi:MAG TPA: YkvA family protein, partial [Kofleriaceae bacterium]